MTAPITPGQRHIASPPMISVPPAMEARIKLKHTGYMPTPVKGKKPVLADWQNKTNASEDEIKTWRAPNTGLLTRLMPTLDIDIKDQAASEAAEALVRQRFEKYGAILVRIGNPPKRAIPFRTDVPFKKITVALTAPDGTADQKIEFLGDGQQVVVAGIHPDTHKPYRWLNRAPGEVKREELPRIDEAEARALINEAVRLLCAEHGYQLASEKPANGGVASEDWSALLANILGAQEWHDSIRDLAAKMIVAGMSAGAVTNMLRALMNTYAGPHDERWRERFDDIPRAVETAEEKFGVLLPSAGLGVWDAGDDTELLPPRGWLLGNAFCREFMSSLLAPGGVGKTALRYAQALALATGRELTGEHIFERGRVLIVSLEDNCHELRRRILAARMHYNIKPEDLKGRLFLAAPGAAGGKLMTADKHGRPIRGQLADLIEAEIVKHKIDLVMIDPFVKSHSVEENLNSSIDDVVQILSDMAAKHSIAVDAPHHTSKGAMEPGNADRGRGASSMRDAARLVYTLAPMSSEEAATFGIPEEDRRSYIRMDSAKVNITPHLGAAKWFRLIGVSLGNETDIYPSGDEVQTVEPWKPPSTWADLSDTLQEQIIAAIDKGLPDGNHYTDAAQADDRGAWKVVLKHAPDKTKGQAQEIIKTWVRTGVLESFKYDNPDTRKKVKGLRKGSKNPTLGGLL